ncbi:hypothetical protein HBB16_04555 [Pseudonocardia sp. MCCB 268]|nr:hypothetical protein [Pseudonocardia cytotoxica]
MLAGLIRASTGRISLDGKDITAATPSDRDIAMVFRAYTPCIRIDRRPQPVPVALQGCGERRSTARVTAVAEQRAFVPLPGPAAQGTVGWSAPASPRSDDGS